jgi:hypothetical protein
MTLVARNRNHLIPSVVSDVLLTIKKVATPIIIPTIGIDISNFVCFLNGQPHALVQKSYILKDNLCIGFAGFRSEIKPYLEDFRIFCRTAPELTQENVTAWIHQNGFEAFQRSAFFIMLMEKKGPHIQVKEITYGDFKQNDNILFEHTAAIGTGTSDFISIIGQKIELTSSFKDGEVGQAIVKNQSLIAKLLTYERYSWGTLQNAWGAAFEWTWYNGVRFEKFGEVAYTLHQRYYKEDGEVILIFPLLILFYKYEGDDLIIIAIEVDSFTHNDTDKYLILKADNVRSRAYCVPPIWDQAKLNDHIDPTSFETYKVAMGFYINTPSGKIFDPSFYTFSLDLKISFDKERDSLEIQYNRELNNLINQKFNETFQFYR